MKRPFSHYFSSVIILPFALLLISFMAISCERNNIDNDEDKPQSHFPQTRAEIEKSVKLSYDISERIFHINDSLSRIDHKIPKEMVRLYGKIPGVKLVGINEEETTIVVMQEDSVTMHIFLDDDSGLDSTFEPKITKSASANHETTLTSASRQNLPSTKAEHLPASIHQLNTGKALFLAPALDSEGFEDPIVKTFIKELELCYNQVDVYENVRADISKFTGAYLSDYDLVVLNAHGTFGYYSMNGDTNEENKEYGNQLGQIIDGVQYVSFQKRYPRYYCLQTNTRYTPEWAEYLINEKKLTWNQVGIYLDDFGGLCFYVTAETLQGASLNETSVLMLCCSSAKLGRNEMGSMMKSFMDAKGLLYLGFESDVSTFRAYGSAYTIIKSMRHGVPFQDVADYARDISFFTQGEEALLKEFETYGPEAKVESYKDVVGSRLVYEQSIYSKNLLLGYVSPFPRITSISTEDDFINISWDCDLEPYSLDILYPKSNPDWSTVRTNAILTHSIEYDLYVDDNLINEGGTVDKTYSIKSCGAGYHTCHVIARLMSSEQEQPIATYKSEEDHFTVETSAEIVTSKPENITTSSASVQVNYTANATVIEQGVVVSTTDRYPTYGSSGCKTIKSSSTSSPFTVQITGLSPETTHYVRGYVLLEDNNSHSLFYSNTVTFTTGEEAKPLISISPTSFKFNDTTVGKRDNRTVTVKNTGNATLTITSQDIPENFRMASMIGSLAPGESKTVNIGFEPKSAGLHEGDIIVRSNAANYDARIHVSGVGVKAEEPKAMISVDKENLDFGTINVGTSRSLPLVITNTGDATLEISKIGVRDGIPVTVAPTSMSIAKGESKSVTVSYKPTTDGYLDDVVFIKSNAENYDTKYVIITGNASGRPEIRIEPAWITFNHTEVGKSDMKTVTIRNIGTATLNITSQDVPENFKMSSAIGTIDPGQSKTVNIGFLPKAAGHHEGDVVIHSNAANNDAFIIRVAGDCYKPVSSSTPGTPVDLGLSVRWANWNVGANSPEEFGSKFSWGETHPDFGSDWETHKFYTPNVGFNKYNGTDGKTTLDMSDDVARVDWRGSWRMPTEKEVQELLDNCTLTWTKQNGRYGHLVKSNKNGNTIFLPADPTNIQENKVTACYWSATLADNEGKPGAPKYYYGRFLWIYDNSYQFSNMLRLGLAGVRPVCK